MKNRRQFIVEDKSELETGHNWGQDRSLFGRDIFYGVLYNWGQDIIGVIIGDMSGDNS
jgi:hypothetical protein